MTHNEQESILIELHRSLDERWRPEEVAQKIITILDLNPAERKILEKAAKLGPENSWSSMNNDFHRPPKMTRQLTVAEELFGKNFSFKADDVKQIEMWITALESDIGKKF